MAFYLLFACGVLGGILGGMGMGGGTLLIPLLTLAGVPQNIAQGLNLLSFLPMSVPALAVHARNGLLDKKGLAWIVLPALLFSAAGAFAAAYLPAAVLRRGFGAFLLALSVVPLRAGLKKPEKIRKKFSA